MTMSALVMLFIGFGVTWGGAAICIRQAWKRLEMVSSD